MSTAQETKTSQAKEAGDAPQVATPKSSNVGPSKEEEQEPSKLTSFRRALAVIIFIATAVLCLLSIWLPQLQVCRTAPGGAQFTNVTTCNPWTLSDVLIPAIFGFLLLLPDFTELSIFNFVTVKRELRLQKQEIDATTSRQDALENQFIAQVSQLAANQNVNNYFYSQGVDASKLVDDINSKESATATEEEHASGRGFTGNGAARTYYAGEEAQMAMGLIAEWDLLTRRLGLNRRRPAWRIDPLADVVIGEFMERYGSDIDTIRRVRNNAAHNVPVGRDDLAGALEGAKTLNLILGDIYRSRTTP